MTSQQFTGIFPALVTPFSKDLSSVDERSLRKLIEFQISAGVDGVVPCGSTGEAATLSPEEYVQVISIAREMSKGKCLCIGGIGANDTKKGIAQLALLESLKVDAALVVTPPYNKPPQRGLVEHFRALKNSSSIPLIAYNVPGRTGVNLLPQTVAELVQEGLIVGIKEACGSIDQVADLMTLVRDKISVMTGECSQVLATYVLGGRGAISASANVAPEKFVALRDAVKQNDWEKARTIQLGLIPLVRAMFMETNPIPAKVGVWLRGLIENPTPRLPLVPAESKTVEKMKELLAM